MCELPFRITVWTIYIRSICSLVLLKSFEILEALVEKDPRSEVIVLSCSRRKVSSKNLERNKKTTVLKLRFKKFSKNKETPSQVFSWEFSETLKNTYFTEHLRWSWILPLKKLYIVGFQEKVFEWLVANEFQFVTRSREISLR